MIPKDKLTQNNLKEKFSKSAKFVKKSAVIAKSALNGVVGDSLLDKNLPFAIQMQFFLNGDPLVLDKKNIKEKYQKCSSKICILVHGLITDESLFNFRGDIVNYGTMLQNDLGFTPFYLRYNSGLHISENGKKFFELLESLILNYPVKIKEIIFITHSMGGLILRSACDLGAKKKSSWVKYIKKIFFLGTPHLGAPLEKFGNLTTSILKILPVPFTKLARNIINLRSSGIKDLRFGYISDEDWKGREPDAFLENNKTNVPLLKKVDYYVITGTLTKDPSHILAGWFGDSVVRKPSAHGKSIRKNLNLYFPPGNLKEFPGVSHMSLAHNLKIYEQVKNWIVD